MPEAPHASETAIIISIGGSPEPILVSLRHHAPKFICYFASQESLCKIGEIQKEIRGIQHHTILVDNPQDLVECYEKACQCADKVRERNFAAEQVRVDFTGGTKTMSAALALATAANGYSFSYVGGNMRSKEGLGVVETGSEQVQQSASPWEVFAIEEQRLANDLFRRRQFEAAEVAFERLSQRALGLPDRLRAMGLMNISKGFGAWERFDYKAANADIEKGRDTLREASRSPEFKNQMNFNPSLQDNLDWIKRCHDALTTPHMEPLALDYFANALRRAEEGRYDDAVLRFYRVLELQGQIAFQKRFSMPTDKVQWDDLQKQVPSLRHEDFQSCCDPKTNLMKFPMQKTFEALAAAQDALGLEFKSKEKQIKALQSKRNYSPLAHGFEPVSQKDCEKLKEIVRGFLPDEPALPQFAVPEAN